MRIVEGTRSVVTGAGSGIGRAISIELARRKARVLAADILLDRAEETCRMIQAEGGESHPFRVDVSKWEEVEAMRLEASRLWGGTDVLVNNAGVAATGRIGSIPLQDWTWLHQINFWGVLYGCHLFLPEMKERRCGALLNVASAAGLISAPELGPYNTAKAAVVSLSETLYGELLGSGVTVTVVCPMGVQTRLVETARCQEPELLRTAVRAVDRSGRTPETLAVQALRHMEKGRLYSVPMWEGRLLWRVKRASPQLYAYLNGRYWPAMKALLARAGRDRVADNERNETTRKEMKT